MLKEQTNQPINLTVSGLNYEGKSELQLVLWNVTGKTTRHVPCRGINFVIIVTVSTVWAFHPAAFQISSY